jgi:hypothetical protein
MTVADSGDEIKKFEVAYFMASTEALEDNIRFANATSVMLGEDANARVVEKEEADFPMLSEPTNEVRGTKRAWRRKPVDVLYRQGRSDCCHRKNGATRNVY